MAHGSSAAPRRAGYWHSSPTSPPSAASSATSNSPAKLLPSPLRPTRRNSHSFHSSAPDSFPRGNPPGHASAPNSGTTVTGTLHTAPQLQDSRSTRPLSTPGTVHHRADPRLSALSAHPPRSARVGRGTGTVRRARAGARGRPSALHRLRRVDGRLRPGVSAPPLHSEPGDGRRMRRARAPRRRRTVGALDARAAGHHPGRDPRSGDDHRLRPGHPGNRRVVADGRRRRVRVQPRVASWGMAAVAIVYGAWWLWWSRALWRRGTDPLKTS